MSPFLSASILQTILRSVSEASVEGSWIQRKDDDLCLYILFDPPPVSPSLYDLNILYVHCFMAYIWPNLYTDTLPSKNKLWN